MTIESACGHRFRLGSTGTRLYRGLAFAVMVGLAGAALGAVPALFIQSIFVGEAQRCSDLLERVAAGAQEETVCADLFKNPAVWLPPAIATGGAAIGIIGGFAYGFATPKPTTNKRGVTERPWLPF